jgi:hypothetical protein
MRRRFSTAVVIAATLALLSACAQTSQSSSEATNAAIQSYINKQVKPYWQGQKERLAKTTATPPSAQYQTIWRELDAAERSLSTNDLLAKAMQGSTPQVRNANMIWLRSRILNGNADSRYSYIYALLLSMSSESADLKPMLQQAATFFFQARIALDIDGARCADRASPSVARRDLEKLPPMAAITTYLANGPRSEVSDALTNATAIEQWRGDRPPQAWLCGLGAATALKAIHNPALVKKDGASMVIDTSGVVPDYVSEEVWHQRKDLILNEQIQAIASHLH